MVQLCYKNKFRISQNLVIFLFSSSNSELKTIYKYNAINCVDTGRAFKCNRNCSRVLLHVYERFHCI